MKDANDILIAGGNINAIPTVSIDMYCAEQVLSKYPEDQPQQYRAMQKFIQTVNNELIKSDIAVMLSKVWSKDIADVRNQLSVKVESEDEKLKDFADVYECMKAFDETLKEEEIGIGYPGVDANVLFQKTDVVLLGAYSNHGKTDNLIEFILHWVIRLRKRVLFFSLEMTKAAVIKTIISKIINVPKYQVRSVLTADIQRQVAEKIEKYLYIIDKNDLSVTDIQEYIRIANTKVFDKPVDICCVDYFGYLKGVKTLEEEAHTAKQLKAVAKSNKVALFVLAQFNKSSQSLDKGQTVKEPMAKDLKGATELYASADFVYLIWRPAKMGQFSPIDYEKIQFVTMLKIEKWRDDLRKGVQTFTIKYNPETGRLTECQ